MTDTQTKDVRNLLERHSVVFIDVPGKTDVIRHRISLTEEEPVRSRPYPLPYAVRDNLKNEITQMLNLGMIPESSSTYASPVVILKKRDGSDRICVDYRNLNKLTVTDPEPIMAQEGLFQRLGKSRFFTKLDLSKGYWQIQVADVDIYKTAFVMQDGDYEFLKMPFGVKNSGATLVHGMGRVLSWHEWGVQLY